MARIHTLKPVGLRDHWRHEAHDFTPWLAENLSLLESELNLVLEREGKEVTLPGSGRVDILARQATTEARVVIENQLGSSDDSHCLRLLGYAANADANILVWVARDFSDYHQSILSWLNESDNIAVYAVEVRAFLVDGRKVVDFNLVVEPPQAGTASASRRKTASTYYAEFYRPVVATLRRSDCSRWAGADSGVGIGRSRPDMRVSITLPRSLRSVQRQLWRFEPTITTFFEL